jgi:hypothetical protein
VTTDGKLKRFRVPVAVAVLALTVLSACSASGGPAALVSGPDVRTFTENHLSQVVPTLSFDAKSPWNVEIESNGTTGITGYDASDQMAVSVQGPPNRVTEIAVVLLTAKLADMSNEAISDAGALVDDVAGPDATRWTQTVLEGDAHRGQLAPTQESRVFGKDRVTVSVTGITIFAMTPASTSPPNLSTVSGPTSSTTSTTLPITTAPASAAPPNPDCTPGDLGQAYTDQAGPSWPSLVMTLSSCDSNWALAVGDVEGSEPPKQDIVIYKLGPSGAQVMTETSLGGRSHRRGRVHGRPRIREARHVSSWLSRRVFLLRAVCAS